MAFSRKDLIVFEFKDFTEQADFFVCYKTSCKSLFATESAEKRFLKGLCGFCSWTNSALEQ
jgi:hypothetical protein